MSEKKFTIEKEYKLSKVDINFNKEKIITYDNNIYLRKLSYGFNTYYSDCIIRLLEALQKIKDYKIWNIINDCYYTINEYDKTIKEEFKNKYKIEFDNNEYYKLYEVLKNYEINIKDSLIFDDITDKLLKSNVLGKSNINKIKINDKENKTYSSIIYNPDLELNRIQEETLLKDFFNILKYISINLNSKGDFVIKIYTNFLLLTNQIIALLTNLFNDVFIYTPNLSEIYRNEKYIICKSFNKNEKILKIIDEIMKIKNNINDCGIELNEEFNNEIKKRNYDLIVYQAYWCNKLIEYLNKQNFYGEDYNKYRNIQIDFTERWCNKFIS